MVRFKMIGLDENASPKQYRTWVVNDEPDFTGAQYTGLKSGTNPLLDITAYEVLDPNAIVDFNLPDPANFLSSKQTLSEVVSNSQLAIIDGYAYLFGGSLTNKIYRANLNTPTNWADTGAKLPTKLFDSQLAVVDGYVYLFGGNDGYGPTDTIFSATIADPLTWTNHGSLLPSKLDSSQLCILNGLIYLFGGKNSSGATNTIFRAPTSNPLSWADTGFAIPHKLFNSALCIGDGYSDGYVELLGGQFDGYHRTDLIYFAPVSNPTSWAVGGKLPAPASGGQFAQVSGRGYLFTPANVGTSLTQIFRCDLTKPFSWINLANMVPGVVSQSQIGIIGDRLFLFGGSGSSVIFADSQVIKYDFTSTAAVKYGNITRTQVANTADPLDLFKVLGMPPWKTNY